MSADVGERHASFFHDLAAGDHARATATALGALPAVLDVLRPAVHRLDDPAETILQSGQVVSDDVRIHGPDIAPQGAVRVNEARRAPGESTVSYPPYAGVI